MSRDRVESAVRLVMTAVVAGIGGAAGFTHTHAWAVANGQDGWLAWSDAVVIECMAVVAGLRMRAAASGHRRFPLMVLVASAALQMVAQVALAPRTPAGWLLAAVPALGFLVIVKLVLGASSGQRVAGPVASPESASDGQEAPVVGTAERDVPELEEARPEVLMSSPQVTAEWPPR